MSLDNECILPSVVIKIFQSDAPARNVSGEHAQPRFQFLRAERAASIVMKEDVGIVRKLGDEKVGKAIVVIILKNHAHARGPSAAFRKRGTGVQTTFGEGTVPVVVEKKLIGDVVGDKDVR